jgi:O-antigen ligase
VATSLERLQLGTMAALAATCAVSIFAAQLFLALSLLVYVARLAVGATRLQRTPLDGPILAFCVWTLLSASFSADPLASHESAKKLVLFALFYLAIDVLRDEESRERILDAALLGGLVLSAGALLQYYYMGFHTLGNRPRSFLGHYMTAAGLLMGTLVLAASRLAFRGPPPGRGSRRELRALAVLGAALVILTAFQVSEVLAVETERLFVAALAAAGAGLALVRADWPDAGTGWRLALIAAPLSAWALVLSQTRNAWLGTLVGLTLLAVLWAPRALWGLAAVVVLLLVIRPTPVVRRLTVTDDSSRDRYYMWQAGIDMVRDRPVFGQGPGRILAVYPSYRWPEAPNPRAPHLHDNALQIAAERGLPCLAWWLWWFAAAMGDAWREFRRGARGGGWVAAAALSFLAAFMAAGLFEYNFGDSEVLMFTLLVSALPYALRRQRDGLSAPSA